MYLLLLKTYVVRGKVCSDQPSVHRGKGYPVQVNLSGMGESGGGLVQMVTPAPLVWV